MSAFQLRHTDDGGAVIEQVAVVEVARFVDAGLAQKAIAALNAEAEAEEPLVLVLPSRTAATVPPEPEDPVNAGEAWEDVWAEARTRLEAGEKLQRVAGALKLDWRKLRGRWARHKKSAGAETPDAPPDQAGEDDEGPFSAAFGAAFSGEMTARAAAEKFGVDYGELCAELRAERGGSS